MDDVLWYWFLAMLKALLWLIECATEFLFGHSLTGGSKQDRIKAQIDYESSAQVVTIIWRAKETLFKISKLDNFIYRHDRYVHPKYILENKNVTLFAVEKDYALFCVTDPSTNIYNTRKFPFLLISQYLEAEKLVILPVSSFHRLANDIGDPKVPVTMVGMTARCGSTLLSQLFFLVPGTRSMAEPWATCNIHWLRCQRKVTPYESQRLLCSAVRLHCKVSADEDVERIVMKMTPFNSSQLVDFANLFPKMTLFFNTRHPVPSIKSLEKALNLVTGDSLYLHLGVCWREWIASRMALPYESKYDSLLVSLSRYFQNISTSEAAVMFYTASLASVFAHKHLFKRIILYENLVGSSDLEVRQIFETMGIHEKHIPVALKALEKDSQNGIFGGIGTNKTKQFEKKLEDFADSFMQKAGVPLKCKMSSVELKHTFGV